MSVLCDIDGVLADFDAAFRAAAQDVLGKTLEGPARCWSLIDAYALTHDEHKAVWDSPALIHHLRFAAVYEGALDMAHRLPPASVYCTARGTGGSRPTEHRKLTLDWLAHNGFPDLPVHFVADKAAHARLWGFRHAIDDAPDQVRSLAAAGLTVWMPHRAYNADVEGEGIVRVGGCGEVMLCTT